ncbi:MAG: hypothetical protein JWM34_1769 [Ilumatobacteraceae bacterium]|nr:hypothetical protein [Ilumatobacteraceae bacterium]
MLDAGEQIQEVFPATTMGLLMTALLDRILFFMPSTHRIVVVTDRRIAVFRSGKFTQGNPKKLLRSVPRNTKIGPPKGVTYKTKVLGEKMFVHKRFHKDVENADARS